jgi:hypothetical protein
MPGQRLVLQQGSHFAAIAMKDTLFLKRKKEKQ